MPSLRVICKGIYEATKWRILCTIPFKSVQNGCVNHGSNLAHYAIVPSQNYILALARGTFDRSSPGQVFIFKIDINNGKYSVYRCSGKSLPPSGIFACAECNDMTVEARNDIQLTITTRGTNRNRNLMEREHEIRLQESRGIFHWFSNTTPPCHSRSPALFALPNIHRQYIQLMIEKEALPCVSFTIQSEWRGPIYKFILRANLASSPFWRTLLSRGYFSDGVFIVIIEGALLTVILRMPTLKELAFM
uniref:Uncharacterized protein n=1 Tax=Acrobeloides nanus TaxID=290746 RepID=A0A914CSE2_9BILA